MRGCIKSGISFTIINPLSKLVSTRNKVIISSPFLPHTYKISAATPTRRNEVLTKPMKLDEVEWLTMMFFNGRANKT